MCFYIVAYSGYYPDLIKVNRWETYYRPQTKFTKVTFLHVCVCPRGGGGGYPSMPCSRCPCRFPGPHPGEGEIEGSDQGGSPGQHPGGLLWGCLLPGEGLQAHTQGGSAPRGVWRPPVTATAAGGTHPTGMHSYFINEQNFLIQNVGKNLP